MDVKEYIASGIVELFAMNALSSEEKRDFERLILLHPEIHEELIRVEEAMENYARANSANPRPQLRAKIIESIGIEKNSIKEKLISINGEPNNELTYKYLIAASLAALVISTFASWFFYSRWEEAEHRYTAILNDKNELAESYNFVKLTYDETVSKLIVIRDENTQVLNLNATDTSKNFKARVYWNKVTHHAYIDILNLPEPGEGKQFQLWTIVEGKPVDAGVFSVDDLVIQQVKDIEAAGAWAVTLEPKGGSVSPTMNQMYLISS